MNVPAKPAAEAVPEPIEQPEAVEPEPEAAAAVSEPVDQPEAVEPEPEPAAAVSEPTEQPETVEPAAEAAAAPSPSETAAASNAEASAEGRDVLFEASEGSSA